jgi:phosphate transport system permease protein
VPEAPRLPASRKAKNLLGMGLLAALAAAALLPLLHIVAVVALNGYQAIARSGLVGFLTEPPNPLDPQHPGGIGPALAGTALLVALSTAMAVALAIPAGVFIAEFRRAGISRLTLMLALILVEFPTVLVGLYIYATEVRYVGRYNMLAGALALAIVILPYMAVQVSEALRHVPQELREAAFSLGSSRLKTVYRVLLSIARRGVLVGVLIGMAKAAGETAPLLFTIGGFFETPPHGLLDRGGAVSLLIYDYAQQSLPGYHLLAWGAALVLLVIVSAIMVAARLLVKEVRL